MVNDTEPPVLTMTTDQEAECSSIPPIPDVTANDTCSAALDINIVFEEVIQAGSCQGESVRSRTWSATDECGNVATETQ